MRVIKKNPHRDELEEHMPDTLRLRTPELNSFIYLFIYLFIFL